MDSIVEIHLDSVDSTNAYAKREYSRFAPDRITCVSAEEQTAGRGRNLRKWISPKGVNLYTTFCFRLPMHTACLGSLSEILAFSLASLLIREGLHPKIKWPNDILLNGKKISGVLCETIFEKQWIQILLGIGVNVNMKQEDLRRIDQPATSLQKETSRPWNRKELLLKLQIQAAADLEKFQKEGFLPFRAPLEGLLAYKGQTIRSFDGKREWVGICHSLALDGRLNLQLADGSIHAMFSGEIDPHTHC